jgi:hypothetical protein
VKWPRNSQSGFSQPPKGCADEDSPAFWRKLSTNRSTGSASSTARFDSCAASKGPAASRTASKGNGKMVTVSRWNNGRLDAGGESANTPRGTAKAAALVPSAERKRRRFRASRWQTIVDPSYRSRHLRKIQHHDHQPQINAAGADQLFLASHFQSALIGVHLRPCFRSFRAAEIAIRPSSEFRLTRNPQSTWQPSRCPFHLPV